MNTEDLSKVPMSPDAICTYANFTYTTTGYLLAKVVGMKPGRLTNDAMYVIFLLSLPELLLRFVVSCFMFAWKHRRHARWPSGWSDLKSSVFYQAGTATPDGLNMMVGNFQWRPDTKSVCSSEIHALQLAYTRKYYPTLVSNLVSRESCSLIKYLAPTTVTQTVLNQWYGEKSGNRQLYSQIQLPLYFGKSFIGMSCVDANRVIEQTCAKLFPRK